METKEDKKIGYGVTEDLYEKRESIENNYINSVRDALNDLVEEAKEYPGWETLVISRLNKRFGFKIGNSTLFLIFEFMNHPNIITRSSSNGNNLRMPIKRNLSYRINKDAFIQFLSTNPTCKDIENKFKICRCSVFNYLKKHHIEYNFSTSVQTLAGKAEG